MKESYVYKGVTYWRDVQVVPEAKPVKIGVLRDYLGETLRERRTELGLTLRDVSLGGVALGYVSEVERGRKEASSEILEALCASLDTTLPEILRRTADRLDAAYAMGKEPVGV